MGSGVCADPVVDGIVILELRRPWRGRGRFAQGRRLEARDRPVSPREEVTGEVAKEPRAHRARLVETIGTDRGHEIPPRLPIGADRVGELGLFHARHLGTPRMSSPSRRHPNAFIDLKRRCRAICIHSQKGLGAVTRVPDMLLAGLPVLATPAAARSFLDLNGVHVYNSAAELRDLITSSLDVPSVPRRPEQLEDDFAEQLKALTLA